MMPIKRLPSILFASLALSCSAWAGSGNGPVAPVAIPPATVSPTITQGQADEILTELKEIRRLLQRMEPPRPAGAAQPSPQPSVPREAAQRPAVPPPPKMPPRPSSQRKSPSLAVRISIADRPVLGEPDAPVTMVEFVDYECPYCRRFFEGAYPRLKREYIDPGKLRLVLKDLPLGFHRQARPAAQAAHCAGEQGKYWPMHDKLFGGGSGLNPGALLAYGDQLSLDGTAFRECLESERHLAQIDADVAESRAAGIPGTPAFVLGPSTGEVVQGAHISGALPFPVFRGRIERLLQDAETQ